MAKEPNISQTNADDVTSFPPVVAVLGHVDHGKTTLLDAIRKTSLADREKGGITQAIGASSITFLHEGQQRSITFIDTPGHEAFGQMRGRGAQAADIALLIVSVVDGVKPQTRESIKVLQESKTPFIVVLTKSDLPNKNIEKTKQEILRENIQLEGYGGDTPVIEVSAKTRHNIQELLDLILLLFVMHKTPAYEKEISSTAPLQAIVIESKLDTKAGPKATIVVKNGSMTVREEYQVNGEIFKVRSLINDLGQQLKTVSVGEAVVVFGFQKVPLVGSLLTQGDHAEAEKEPTLPDQQLQRDMIYHKKDKTEGLSVVLIADTQGSLEAIENALPEGIKVLTQKTGDVTEADILHAKSTGSIVISFGIKVKPEIERFAFTEKVLVRNYDIIYELLDELSDALEGKLLSQMEQVYGQAKVLAKFPFEKTFAFGVSVEDGRIARGDKIRIQRGEEEIVGECTIQSLRIGKNSTSKVEKGHEAGIILNPELDIHVGDVLISHS